MRIISYTILMFISCILLCLISFSQNVTIDYAAWNPQSPPCNIFGSTTNVPATINGNPGTIAHRSQIGQPAYSSSDLSIWMNCNYVSNPLTVLGTLYRLTYNFKVGYRYIITVTAAEYINTQGYPTGPYLRLDMSNDGSSRPYCNGPEPVTQNFNCCPAPYQLSTTSFQDYQFVYNTLSSSFSYLQVSSLPPATDATNAIRIKKITIAETAPTPTFTVTPNPFNIACGTATQKRFLLPTFMVLQA